MASDLHIDSVHYKLTQHERTIHIVGHGDWTLKEIGEIDPVLTGQLNSIDYDDVEFDLSGVTALDTAGAFMLARAIHLGHGECHLWSVVKGDKGQRTLMQAAAEAVGGVPPNEDRPWYNAFSRVGLSTERFWHELVETMAFVGKFFIVLARLAVGPTRIRWKSVVALTEEIGLNAAPIVMTLCFFIGAVIAYMGANLLSSFGASIFMVDLVGIAVLRELAPIITAILIAGRSDSAFTAQIGAMKMRQEIDAMTVIGLDTYEVLVVPRALACLISLPILTFLGMMSGLFAGMLIAWTGGMDISPVLFCSRLNEVVGIKHFFVGIVKTPFFAIIIAIIGCRQGLAVTGSVDSLGSRTTTSVVQAIFAVITVNAMFSILFFTMGV